MGRRRKRKKCKPKGDIEPKIMADVPISFSADAQQISNRLVKPMSNVGNVIGNNTEELIEQEEAEKFDVEEDEKELQSEKKRVLLVENFETWSEPEGIIYPFDLWETLSQYILPETVNIFSQLCRYSYICVNQPKFWLTMYQNFAVNYPKRHLQNNGCVSLPEHFSPEYVNKQCRGNLRIHVVRALFHTYGPLRDRLVSPKNTWRGDPHSIVGMICLSAWTARKSSNYRFCFKLSKKQFINGARNTEQQTEVTNEWEDLEEDLELPDVGISSEEKCLLLHLDTNAFSFLPGSLIGLKVHDVNVTSCGEGFRYQKVNLILGPLHIRSEKDCYGRVNILTSNSVTVSIGNVVAIRLLEWFHPLYIGCEEM